MYLSNVIITDDVVSVLDKYLSEKGYDKIFVLTDSNTKVCIKVLSKSEYFDSFIELSIGQGDSNKNIDSAVQLWGELQKCGCSRKSLLINLGGGMITDLGGFVASTFKRGVAFVNIPTSLLAMIDASVGSKTGINFLGLKNEIGTFCDADMVVIDRAFLSTLDRENLFAGYAEMIKHGLISDENHWAELLNYDIDCEDERLSDMITNSVNIKSQIVEKDPKEKGLRKALNFGHTTAHAFESLCMSRGKEIKHGYAVAWGMVCELYMSVAKCGFPTEKMKQTVNYIKDVYGSLYIDCSDYEDIYSYMLHDKKNSKDEISFTLLKDIGQLSIDNILTKDEIFEMLDFYREIMNI